jgi:hypothetical protein
MLSGENIMRAVEATYIFPRIDFKPRRSDADIKRDLEMNFEVSRTLGGTIPMSPFRLWFEYTDTRYESSGREATAQRLFRYNGHMYFDTLMDSPLAARSFCVGRMTSCQLLTPDSLWGRAVVSAVESKSLAEFAPWQDFDFFCHPKAWGNFRRPMAIIQAAADEFRLPFKMRFEILSEFASESLKHGQWRDWYHDGKAAGLALQAFRLKSFNLDWRSELKKIENGRFRKSAFQHALDSVVVKSVGK